MRTMAMPLTLLVAGLIALPTAWAQTYGDKEHGELDKALQQVNSDYEAKRHKDIAMRRPVLHILKKGVFNKWLKEKGKLGGQHKVPRLSNDRKFIEEIKLLM